MKNKDIIACCNNDIEEIILLTGIPNEPTTKPNKKYKVLHLSFLNKNEINLEINIAPKIAPKANTAM